MYLQVKIWGTIAMFKPIDGTKSDHAIFSQQIYNESLKTSTIQWIKIHRNVFSHWKYFIYLISLKLYVHVQRMYHKDFITSLVNKYIKKMEDLFQLNTQSIHTPIQNVKLMPVAVECSKTVHAGLWLIICRLLGQCTSC